MLNLLFSARGRINRGKFWLAALISVSAGMALCALLALLWQVIPGEVDENGNFAVNGLRALPYIVLVVGYVVLSIWSGICIGIKRFHDRDKSGAWILIQFVPVIGPFWYFIEAGCLRGTVGPNRFGTDPLTQVTYAAMVPAE